ncbi:DUF58 domain-containing protein [Alicyclobacillus mali (ex Roth et al. 2021)]|uniref:DUF58 domain-containing protein n=1 Tax=Alicyclobacillus mali (ex Roth et al. 2021) TaxID=1123961 RepID=UPI000834B173|nr:DUF58 domain-containing protein [Alicyclobacillus mali (ex Roth et al. 2021)]
MSIALRRSWLVAALILASAFVTSLALGTGAVGVRALAGAMDALSLYELCFAVCAMAISSAQVDLPARASAGDSARVLVDISGRAFGFGLWRRRGEIALEWEEHRVPYDRLGGVASFKRAGGYQVQMEASSLRRGQYRLRGVCVRLSDAFGLLFVEWRLPAEGVMVVYPKVLPAGEWTREVERQVRACERARDDARTVPTGGLVPFRTGERRSLIHWPTSLRMGNLYARELAFDRPRPWLVVPLAEQNDVFVTEQVLSVAFSLVVHWQRQGQSVECLAPASTDGRATWRRCRTFDEVGRALASVNASATVAAVPRAELRGEWGATIWVTARACDAIARTVDSRAVTVSAVDVWAIVDAGRKGAREAAHFRSS